MNKALIGLVLLLTTFCGCKKEKCENVSTGACVAYNDTAAAYQALLGKWYLKRRAESGPQAGSYDYPEYCYDDKNNSIEFLPDRTIHIKGDMFPEKTVACKLRFGDSIYSNQLFNEVKLFGTNSHYDFSRESIDVCEKTVTIQKYDVPSILNLTYKRM